jgi:hypothetical protein
MITRTNLRYSLTITELHQAYFPGDYVRTLYKLSKALRQNPDSKLEGDEKAKQATQLLRGIHKGPVLDEELDSEIPYDDIVCTTWR